MCAAVDPWKAATAGDLDAIMQYIENGGDVNCRDANNNTPLHWACQESHFDIVGLLMCRGAAVDPVNDLQSTPMHYSARNGNLDIVSGLINFGANLEMRNKDNLSPLHVAAGMGRVEVTAALVANGADKEAMDNACYTPLWRAAYYGHPEVVRLLVASGANTQAKNKKGKKPGENFAPTVELIVQEEIRQIFGVSKAKDVDVLSPGSKGPTPPIVASPAAPHRSSMAAATSPDPELQELRKALTTKEEDADRLQRQMRDMEANLARAKAEAQAAKAEAQTAKAAAEAAVTAAAAAVALAVNDGEEGGNGEGNTNADAILEEMRDEMRFKQEELESKDVEIDNLKITRGRIQAEAASRIAELEKELEQAKSTANTGGCNAEEAETMRAAIAYHELEMAKVVAQLRKAEDAVADAQKAGEASVLAAREAEELRQELADKEAEVEKLSQKLANSTPSEDAERIRQVAQAEAASLKLALAAKEVEANELASQMTRMEQAAMESKAHAREASQKYLEPVEGPDQSVLDEMREEMQRKQEELEQKDRELEAAKKAEATRIAELERDLKVAREAAQKAQGCKCSIM